MADNDKPAILILGATYGLLFAARAALGGYNVDIVGHKNEIDAINSDAVNIQIPTAGRGETIEISSRTARLNIRGIAPANVDLGKYGLIVLAMQESQFANPELHDLCVQIARSQTAVLSIMNMALPPYLKRLDNLWDASLSSAYHAAELWEHFDPASFSHSSPDPQAIRPDPSQYAQLQVRLPSNFKIAPFEKEADQQFIQQLCRNSKSAPNLNVETAKKPRVYFVGGTSIYTPMAKWPMLITGNYRCITSGAPQSIRDAVLGDMAASEEIFNSVLSLCQALGAPQESLVPFSAYAKAAHNLDRPSSVANALNNGGVKVERMDMLIEKLLGLNGLNADPVKAITSLVSEKIAAAQ